MAKQDDQFDMTLMAQVRARADYLKSLHAARNTMDDKMERALLLTWDEESKTRKVMENVKITKHPGARNALLGAMRLLIASDPTFSLSHDTNDTEASGQSEAIEKFSETMWQAAGRIRQRPVHYDVVSSILTFAEVHIGVTKTQDMVESAKGGTKAAQVKAEAVAEITPYAFDVWDPRTGYPEIDPRYGLTSFYREVLTTSGAVLDEFGDAARAVFKDSSKRYDATTLCHFWDYENRFVWIRGQARPLIQEAHGLPFIPVVVQLGEGSQIYSKPEYQRQPFLYTMIESGLWSRQNLMLTVMYTLAFAIGSNPLYVYQTNMPGKQLNVDWSRPGGVASIESNESLSPMLKQVLDPSLMTSYEIAQQLAQESTIYGQTLGEPIGGTQTFSTTALLHQAGRLPLLVPQRLASWAIADAVKMALLWIKADGSSATTGYKHNARVLQPSEIPDSFELEAKLDIDLPQDMMQQANTAGILTNGEQPLASQQWVRENVLNMGRPQEMQSQIWGEQAAATMFTLFLQDQIEVMKQKQMQQQQPPPGQMPPEQMPPGQPQPGMEPQLQGLPPEMAQGGGQPPMMPPGMPPGAPPMEGM